MKKLTSFFPLHSVPVYGQDHEKKKCGTSYQPQAKAFNTKSGPQWKDRKSSSQVKQIFVLFCKLVALNLG